jgi:DNA-binding MarR family transcriptional regulator
LLLGGLARWGYVRLTSPSGQDLKKPAQGDTLVRLTRHGRAAFEVWPVLPQLMDERWRARFGDAVIDGLRSSVETICAATGFDTPDYLPPVFPTQNGKAEAPPPRNADTDGRRAAAPPNLANLLAGVLLTFTLDFETASRISLPISANTLRVLNSEGVRIRDLPALTGVSKEANAMCTGWLQRRGCAEQARDPNASRGQVLRLTTKGQAAQAKYRSLLAETEADWRSTCGADTIGALRAMLEPLVGDGTLPSSPLAAGLEPHPGNWRAGVRRPATLPHYPMVLHRGAYPDGS